MKEKIQERINIVKTELEKSAANHNALLGRFAELSEILDFLQKEETQEEPCHADS